MNSKKIITVVLSAITLLSSIPIPIEASGNVIYRPHAITEYNKYTFDDLNQMPKLNNVLKRNYKPVTIKIMGYDGQIKDVTRYLRYPIRNMDGRIAVAITDFTKMFNVQVNWFQKEKIVVLGDIDKFRAVNGKEYVKLIYIPIRKGAFKIDDSIIPVEIPAVIDPILNKTYLPVRSIAELLDYDVNWDNNTSTVTLFPKI